MKIAITGSRFGLSLHQRTELINLLCSTRMTEFHYGCCVGVDTQALWLAVETGAGGVIHAHPATKNPEWDTKYVEFPTEEDVLHLGIQMHPAKDPLERNREMVDAVDVVWAFPNSNAWSGTLYTITYARAQKKEVIVTGR